MNSVVVTPAQTVVTLGCGETVVVTQDALSVVTAAEQGPAGIQGSVGPKGDAGATGAAGSPGPGVAAGGTTGQYLRKNSGADYDASWAGVDASPGGSEGQVQFNNGGAFGGAARLSWDEGGGGLVLRVASGNGAAIKLLREEDGGTVLTVGRTAGIEPVFSGGGNPINWDGSFLVNGSIFVSPDSFIGGTGGNARAFFGAGPNPGINVVSQSAGACPFVVQGAASQNANLQEWRDASGNVLSRKDALGREFIGPPIGTLGGHERLWINRGTASNGQKVIRVVEGSFGQERFSVDGEGNIQAFSLKRPDDGPMTFDGGLVFGGFNRRLAAVNDHISLEIYANGQPVLHSSNSAAVTPVVVRGQASQSANLLEVQSSSGVVRSRVTSKGSGITLGDVAAFDAAGGSAHLGWAVSSSAKEYTSLLQVYDTATGSNPILLDASGRLSLSDSGGATIDIAGSGTPAYGWRLTSGFLNHYGGYGHIFRSGATEIVRFDGTADMASISISGSSLKGLTIKAAASQGANLQEWQDPSGAPLSYVSSNGRLFAPLGTGTAPGISFVSAGSTSGFRYAGNRVVVMTAGTDRMGFGSTALLSSSANGYAWSSTTSLSGAPDTGMYRGAAGVVEVTNGFSQANGGSLAKALAAELEAADSARGLVLKSPDGARWRIQVTNAGALTATAI